MTTYNDIYIYLKGKVLILKSNIIYDLNYL